MCDLLLTTIAIAVIEIMANVTALTVPEQQVMEGWQTIADARLWAGVTDSEWTKLAEALGDPEANALILMASIDDEDWIAARNQAGLPIIRKGAANLLFAAIKAKFEVATKINAPRAKPPEHSVPQTAEQQQGFQASTQQQQQQHQGQSLATPQGQSMASGSSSVIPVGIETDDASPRTMSGQNHAKATGNAITPMTETRVRCTN